jgi:hypothetical protein
MTMPKYYLSSLDSYALEFVRTCDFVAFMQFDTGKVCAVAVVDPPISGQQFGLDRDVTEVVLTNRHEGDDLKNIAEFPCFVHVARPLVPDIRSQNVVTVSNLENLAWGELYRSRSDAENHVFDN